MPSTVLMLNSISTIGRAEASVDLDRRLQCALASTGASPMDGSSLIH
jgi:hypothetical protein